MGGLSNDIVLKLKKLVVWLEEQILKDHPPEKQRQLQRALELAHKLQNNPAELQILLLLDELLGELGQPSLGHVRVLFQGGVNAFRSAPDTMERSQMKFSGPRDQCPKCGESKESCSCQHK